MSKQFTLSNSPIDWPARPKDFSSDDNLGLSTNDTTQRFVLGTRHIAWDGSVYKYVKASSTYTFYERGVWDSATGGDVAFESLGAASAAGSNVVTLTQGSITEDQYAGGYLIIFHATGGGQTYGIQGNEATSGTITTLYLDRPLPVAVTTSDNIELYANPYSTVKQGESGGGFGFVGIPMALLTNNQFGWIKSRGPTFVAPQADVGNAQGGEGVYWRTDGSVDIEANITSTVTTQYAGYVMTGSAGGNGPLIMLQGSL